MSNPQRAKLAPDIVKRLRTLATSADEKTSARARLILRDDEGISVAEIAAEMGMSQSGVRHWLKQFRERGIAALEGKDSAETEAAHAAPEATTPPVETDPTPAKGTRGRRKASATEAKPESAPVVPPLQQPPPPAPEPDEDTAPAKPRRGRSKASPPEPAVSATVAIEAPARVEALAPAAEPAPEPPRRARTRKAKGADEVAEAPAPAAGEGAEAAEPAAPATGRSRRGRPATKRAEAPEAPPAPPPPPPVRTVRELVEKYGVNLAHAEHVTAQAYRLFDETAEIHRLPDHERRLLQAGALLHGIADNIDIDNHHERARDIILETPLEKFTEVERSMVALIAAFHRKKVHPEREPVFAALPTMLQRDTLGLAAILRIADGLDASQTQTTQIANVSYSGREITVLVTGDQAVQDAQRARSKADLWLQQFGQHAIIEPVPERGLEVPEVPILSAPPLLRDQMPDLVVNLDPSMSAARAVRKIGLHYADRVERLAGPLRAGDERRLNALEREVQRLQGILVLAEGGAFIDSLHRLHDSIAEAVIAFELYDRALVIADDPDEPGAPVVASRMDSWRDAAREKLRELDLDQLTFVLGEIRKDLVNEPVADSGALITTLVAPTVWKQLSDLRDIVERGESVTDALTAARRLQDYLLYFRSLIGAETMQALDMLIPFEGFLNAIHIAQQILGNLGIDQASSILRAAQEKLLNELADELPTIWASINSVVFRRAVALALAAA